jgi:hypothetical protein
MTAGDLPGFPDLWGQLNPTALIYIDDLPVVSPADISPDGPDVGRQAYALIRPPLYVSRLWTEEAVFTVRNKYRIMWNDGIERLRYDVSLLYLRVRTRGAIAAALAASM